MRNETGAAPGKAATHNDQEEGSNAGRETRQNVNAKKEDARRRYTMRMGDQDNLVYVTGIKIFSDTRDRLLAKGWKYETYDSLINRLIDESDRRASR